MFYVTLTDCLLSLGKMKLLWLWDCGCKFTYLCVFQCQKCDKHILMEYLRTYIYTSMYIIYYSIVCTHFQYSLQLFFIEGI